MNVQELLDILTGNDLQTKTDKELLSIYHKEKKKGNYEAANEAFNIYFNRQEDGYFDRD